MNSYVFMGIIDWLLSNGVGKTTFLIQFVFVKNDGSMCLAKMLRGILSNVNRYLV